jgi:hypothetical protein
MALTYVLRDAKLKKEAKRQVALIHAHMPKLHIFEVQERTSAFSKHLTRCLERQADE